MKKALSIVLALMMVLSTVSLAAPTMVSTVTDANETSVDATEIEKTALASTTSEAATFKPGVNILTGTEEAFNFDNDAYTLVGTGNRNVYLDGKRIFVLSDGTASITESPVAGESTNKALKMGGFSVEAGKTSYPQVINFAGSLPEDSRPVFVGIKTLVANGDNVASGSSGSGLRVGANNSTTAPYANGNYTYVNLYTSTQTPTAWLNYGTMDKVSTTALPRFVYNIKAVESAATVDIYMDDIYMTPYYKVTYMNGDQQIGEPVWVLDDGKGNILDSFNPVDYFEGEYPAGTNAWSLKKDGKPTHNITLNNEDIVVYAVHERNFTPGINMLTGTEDALDFNSGSTSGVLYKDAYGETVLKTGGYYNKLELVDSPVAGETGNKVLKASSFSFYTTSSTSTSYPTLVPTVSLPDDNRPVFTSVKALLAKGDAITVTGDSPAIRFGADGKNTGTTMLGGIMIMPKFSSNETPTGWKYGFAKDDVSKTSHSSLAFIFRTASKQPLTENDVAPELYFDDVMYVPYYKVTYMNGDQQIGEPVWVLDDGKGKILDSFNPVDYFEGEYPAGTNAWSLTKDGKPTHNITLNNEDIVVYAVHERNFTPGINMLTGTEEALDFDNDAYNLVGTGNRNVWLDGKRIFVLSDGTASITESPVEGESTNKALKMGGISVEAGKTSYPQLFNFVGTLPDEAGRPVFVGIKTLVANGDNVASGSSYCCLRVGANNIASPPYANGNYTYVNLYTSSQTPTAWLNYGTMDKVSTTALPIFVYNIKAGESAATVDIYMDDIYMTPYYKVTYMNGDQQIGEPVWVLDDGKGNILDSFNPAEQGVELPEGKNIWSLKDGGEAVTQVALEYKDIVLYAGYDEEIQDELCPESYFTSSIRTADPSGIRFRASVTTEQKTQAEEYGFIVTLEKHLGTTAAESLTMESNITKQIGVSYGYDSKIDKNVDRIYEIEDNNIFFTAALYGMPETDDAYRQKIIVRPYLKDKDGNYHYAQPIIRSVLDVATAIRDGGYTVVDEYGKKYVENILSVCKESQN